MIKNYLKIALRQLRNQKMYSAIKIGGLSLGIAACLLIALYIRDGLSYDRSYTDSDRIHRIVGFFDNDGTVEKGASMPPPLAKALREDLPEVEESGRIMQNTLFWGAGNNYLRSADEKQNTYEHGFAYADPEILDIFKFSMIYGDRSAALKEPFTMVISKSKADKYFHGQNPIGKVMYLNDDKERAYRITGVMQDLPENSHLKYHFFLTLSGKEFWQGEQTGWRSSNYHTYVMLRPGTDIPSFNKKMSGLVANNYILPVLVADGVKDAAEVVEKESLALQALTDIYLKSYDIDDELSHGDIRFVWLFAGIAGFILLIACINFINLSTAKSAKRAKEVGLRKVVGSSRGSLIKQFLTESFLFSFLSFVIALLIAWALIPSFNILSAKSLSMPWSEWWLLPSVISSACVIGVVAGLYPSLYLSSFSPASVLKGQLNSGTRGYILRNGLVVFQFTISIILIIGTLVINSQMRYIQNRDVGFDKEQVLLIYGSNTLERVKDFKEELLKLPLVKSVSISDYLPVSDTKRNGNTFWNEGRSKEENGVDTQFWIVDHDYVTTLGLKIVAGRNFSMDMPTDSQGVVINKTMAKQLNLKDPVGKIVTNRGEDFPVIGVVEDFNYESMRNGIGALCLKLGNSSSIISVKANSRDMKSTVEAITTVWKKFAPDQAIRYTFMDESFASMYADVQRMGNVFTTFAVLAIIIACLGLFALSAFMAEQRNKEIGVRKVLGASVQGITAMLSKDFVKLVLISIVIASPIAWWAMSKWLEDYTYRTPISGWMFITAGILVTVIALVTVSFQSIRAALMNPVKSLRSE